MSQKSSTTLSAVSSRYISPAVCETPALLPVQDIPELSGRMWQSPWRGPCKHQAIKPYQRSARQDRFKRHRPGFNHGGSSSTASPSGACSRLRVLTGSSYGQITYHLSGNNLRKYLSYSPSSTMAMLLAVLTNHFLIHWGSHPGCKPSNTDKKRDSPKQIKFIISVPANKCVPCCLHDTMLVNNCKHRIRADVGIC